MDALADHPPLVKGGHGEDQMLAIHLGDLAMSVTVGLKGRAEAVVSGANTAQAACSGALPVFGTPFMCALMEEAAWKSIAP